MSKGQITLDYFIEYGWALIVIAIVIGVIVFIVGASDVSNQTDDGQRVCRNMDADFKYYTNGNGIRCTKTMYDGTEIEYLFQPLEHWTHTYYLTNTFVALEDAQYIEPKGYTDVQQRVIPEEPDEIEVVNPDENALIGNMIFTSDLIFDKQQQTFITCGTPDMNFFCIDDVCLTCQEMGELKRLLEVKNQ